jgi:hypothetical protein
MVPLNFIPISSPEGGSPGKILLKRVRSDCPLSLWERVRVRGVRLHKTTFIPALSPAGEGEKSEGKMP